MSKARCQELAHRLGAALEGPAPSGGLGRVGAPLGAEGDAREACATPSRPFWQRRTASEASELRRADCARALGLVSVAFCRGVPSASLRPGLDCF